MEHTRARPLERTYALELVLARVRLFGVAFGAALTLAYSPNPGAIVPPSARLVAGAALIGLAVANSVLMFWLRGGPRPGLHRVGLAMFMIDIAALWTLVWAYTADPFDNSWVVLSVLAMEGAFRYELRGGLVVPLLSVPIETARAVFFAVINSDRAGFGPAFLVTGVTYRVGVLLMVGTIAGVMARNLERAREAAESHGREHELAAAGEREARRESMAFQRVILAGVSAEQLDDVLTDMIAAVSTELGYERIAVLMRHDGERLVPVAIHGFTPDVRAKSVKVGEGIAGKVVQEGITRIVPDVLRDPDYYSVDATTRAQITLPIKVEGEIIGVLEVESSELNAFAEADRSRLERLCAQMGLVIQNARLLEAERATVERLQELDQLKSDFIAIASHELRTPLTAMRGSITVLLRGVDAPTTAELLGILDRQTDRLTRVVEDLLLTSRVAAGHVQLQMNAVDVSTVIADALAELGARADRVSVAVSQSLPRIVTDGDRMGQIVRNLVENALKFSPPAAPVRVTAQIASDGLVIEVADEGPGIEAADLSRIFERFHQVGGSMGRRSDGLGLGLFITKRLVEALGGTIEVDSEVERGSTFRVTVPLAAARDAADEIA